MILHIFLRFFFFLSLFYEQFVLITLYFVLLSIMILKEVSFKENCLQSKITFSTTDYPYRHNVIEYLVGYTLYTLHEYRLSFCNHQAFFVVLLKQKKWKVIIIFKIINVMVYSQY